MARGPQKRAFKGTRAILLDRTRIPGPGSLLAQPYHRPECTTSDLGDDPAADPPARAADRLDQVIVGVLVNDDRRAVLIEKRRRRPARDRDAGREELRPRAAVGCRVEIREVPVVGSCRVAGRRRDSIEGTE